MKITCYTAELVNPDANHDKMYRTYALPDGSSLWQWGSQRTGRTGGQFKQDGRPAALRLDQKVREGYTKVAEYSFDVPGDRFDRVRHDPKKLGLFLDGIRGSSEEGREDQPLNSRGVVIGTRPVPAGTAVSVPAQTGDSLSLLTGRVQAAITMAVEDPRAAMIEFALLRDDLDLLDEQTLKLRSFYQTLELLVMDSVTGR